MPEGIEYVNDEFGPNFDITIGKCFFKGFVLERKSGGFDLFLDRNGSELDCLTIDQHTWLRHQCVDRGCLYLGYFAQTELSKELRHEAQERLGSWLQQNLGLPYDSKKKVTWIDHVE